MFRNVGQTLRPGDGTQANFVDSFERKFEFLSNIDEIRNMKTTYDLQLVPHNVQLFLHIFLQLLQILT